MNYIKKCFLALIIIIESVFSIIGVHAVYEEFVAHRTDTGITIDNAYLEFDKPIVTINDSIYVPLRETFEQMGFDVKWSLAGVDIYSRDIYNKIIVDGYIYHCINYILPIDKVQLSEDGLINGPPLSKYSINEFITTEDVTKSMVGILDNSSYSSFKNDKNWYFNLYSANDCWIVNLQTKEIGIYECAYYFIIDKKNGDVEEYNTWGMINGFSNYVHFMRMRRQGDGSVVLTSE